jgi:hypothetical protein
VRNDPGLGRVAVVELSRDPFYGTTWYLRKRHNEVWLHLPGASGPDLDAPSDWVKILSPPLRPERSWLGNRTWGVGFEVRALEDITTPAGSFRRCVRIRVSGEGDVIDYWLAPNAGLVRWQRRLGPGRIEDAAIVLGD